MKIKSFLKGSHNYEQFRETMFWTPHSFKLSKIKPILFLNSQLGREREERNYYQLERDRLSTFWDVAQKQLDESRAECRVKGTIHLIFFQCTIVQSNDSMYYSTTEFWPSYISLNQWQQSWPLAIGWKLHKPRFSTTSIM